MGSKSSTMKILFISVWDNTHTDNSVCNRYIYANGVNYTFEIRSIFAAGNSVHNLSSDIWNVSIILVGNITNSLRSIISKRNIDNIMAGIYISDTSPLLDHVENYRVNSYDPCKFDIILSHIIMRAKDPANQVCEYRGLFHDIYHKSIIIGLPQLKFCNLFDINLASNNTMEEYCKSYIHREKRICVKFHIVLDKYLRIPSVYRSSSIIFLIYDIGNMNSFNILQTYIDLVRTNAMCKHTIVITGMNSKGIRIVDIDIAKAFALKSKCKYFEPRNKRDISLILNNIFNS